MKSSFRKTYEYLRYGAPVYDDEIGEDITPAPETMTGVFSIQPAKLDEAMSLSSSLEGNQEAEVFKVYTDVQLECQRTNGGIAYPADEIIYIVGSRKMHLRIIKHMPNVATRLRHNKYYAQAVYTHGLS